MLLTSPPTRRPAAMPTLCTEMPETTTGFRPKSPLAPPQFRGTGRFDSASQRPKPVRYIAAAVAAPTPACCRQPGALDAQQHLRVRPPRGASAAQPTVAVANDDFSYSLKRDDPRHHPKAMPPAPVAPNQGLPRLNTPFPRIHFRLPETESQGAIPTGERAPRVHLCRNTHEPLTRRN
jgi:hypothetical protein